MSESSRNKMQAVLNFINEYNAEYGYSPTVREICARAGVNLALLYAQKQRMAIPQMREDVGFICPFAAFR